MEAGGKGRCGTRGPITRAAAVVLRARAFARPLLCCRRVRHEGGLRADATTDAPPQDGTGEALHPAFVLWCASGWLVTGGTEDVQRRRFP